MKINIFYKIYYEHGFNGICFTPQYKVLRLLSFLFLNQLYRPKYFECLWFYSKYWFLLRHLPLVSTLIP